MSPGALSGVISLVLLVLFVAGWFWVWSPKRREVFDAAARLPLEGSEGDAQ
ncbi:cbb3-type cytochrome c oxidase subunit 3 [Lysobacter sp. HDW10]|uniref:cbb3-type cytochrome oxidase subunit 3 n=1 Tax=Lysobacter sp. HDW10 TaxID=2714936 RepID=UPI00140972FB|nr:cbb3-type cytochrome c oxidase subunit 3 [Lysobacter sp. HDW10]QIK80208.1 cbb3-type cytochrome c oxidase subunit 3 [Lysobacter sp. HDW10]